MESSGNRCADYYLVCRKAFLDEVSIVAVASVADKPKEDILSIGMSTLNTRPSQFNLVDPGMPLLSPSGSDALFFANPKLCYCTNSVNTRLVFLGFVISSFPDS